MKHLIRFRDGRFYTGSPFATYNRSNAKPLDEQAAVDLVTRMGWLHTTIEPI